MSAQTSALEPRAFRTPADFRRWLEQNHAKAKELLIRLFKVHALDRGIGYSQALDEALCFGWIDGVRRALDDESFTQRFTPRQPKSYWSAINITRAQALIRAERMRPPGQAAFDARPEKAGRYSFESKPVTLDAAFVKEFRRDAFAWAFYRAQPPWYRRTSAFWVMSAKRPETRERRFRTLLDRSAQRLAIPLLVRPSKKEPA